MLRGLAGSQSASSCLKANGQLGLALAREHSQIKGSDATWIGGLAIGPQFLLDEVKYQGRSNHVALFQHTIYNDHSAHSDLL